MHGFVIEERVCPRCQILRTVRFGRTLFCFNCRWSSEAATVAPAPSDSYAFSPEDLARLRVYRAAVRHGFYTDELRA
jgi:hypothetical protein